MHLCGEHVKLQNKTNVVIRHIITPTSSYLTNIIIIPSLPQRIVIVTITTIKHCMPDNSKTIIINCVEKRILIAKHLNHSSIFYSVLITHILLQRIL